MPNVMGSDTKFRKLSLMSFAAKNATIPAMPSSSVASTPRDVRLPRKAITTTSTVPMREAAIAFGASSTTAISMSAKMTARPEPAITSPFGSVIVRKLSAQSSR
jgi:hypothetical protein